MSAHADPVSLELSLCIMAQGPRCAVYIHLALAHSTMKWHTAQGPGRPLHSHRDRGHSFGDSRGVLLPHSCAWGSVWIPGG